MKYQNIIVYLIIPLLSYLFRHVQHVNAQTNSDNQTEIPQQENQNMTLTTQALMKADIFELQDTLMKAKLAIVDGNFEEALTDVRNVESQLLEIESSPIQVIKVLHKAIHRIASSDIDKSLNSLTRIQITLLKAENQIFKAWVADPQVIQQFDTLESNTNEENEDDEDTIVPNMLQQFDPMESNSNEEDYTDIEDS